MCTIHASFEISCPPNLSYYVIWTILSSCQQNLTLSSEISLNTLAFISKLDQSLCVTFSLICLAILIQNSLFIISTHALIHRLATQQIHPFYFSISGFFLFCFLVCLGYANVSFLDIYTSSVFSFHGCLTW